MNRRLSRLLITMERQLPTPSPSSLASLLNPVIHSPPPAAPSQHHHHHHHHLRHHQQDPLFRKLHHPKQIISHHKPTMSTLTQNHLQLTSSASATEQQQQHHHHHQQPPFKHPTSAASTASSSTSPSLTIESNLEESIFGIAPFNDFTWTIAQFIWQHSREYWLRGEAHLVEVEAKLGTIRDRSKQSERIEYPIATESPILNTAHTKFQSDMPPSHHANLNRLLNQRVTETNAPGYCGAKVDYLHLKQVDEFHQGKVRVSRDSSGNKSPPRSIIKEKLAHLDIHCPGRSFDFRISVNIEHPVPLPPEHSTPTFRRIKDRLSYSHQITQIDLTQVKSTDQNASTSTHEVEVEFKDSTELLRAASIWASEREEGEGGASRNGDRPEDDQRPSSARRLSRSQHQLLDAQEYLLMVDVLLNNVRMLIRNC
ncbi:hypothetical protein PTTG_08089 [Puccinia triticina 1-1 BBBD Race 1]|uniref:mRNA-capping enzyme subunit beta n=1 Tax=Puccinia triticina (isolate 1-1 / race 1 (BBBD)) TaxID=630390 RepID=A0A180GWP9_PUCT1|nr:hypothetical protein PTTG_08089 [Puccinia triticina 1-1 BBBD Race 1]